MALLLDWAPVGPSVAYPEFPEPDLSVWVRSHTGTSLGYYDGRVWRDVSTSERVYGVLAWASLPSHEPTHRTTTGRPEAYPWDQWLNGQEWRLVPGTDFEVSLKSMQSAVSHAIKKRNLRRVRNEQRNGFLYIQVEAS